MSLGCIWRWGDALCCCTFKTALTLSLPALKLYFCRWEKSAVRAVALLSVHSLCWECTLLFITPVTTQGLVFTATGLSLVWEFSLREASAISSPQPSCSEHQAQILTASRCPGPLGHGPVAVDHAGWASESSCCLPGAQQEPEPWQQLAPQRRHCSGTEEKSRGQAELQQCCPVSCRMEK